MTLSVDICGPFRPGEDFRKKAKYFLGGLCHSKVMEEPPEQPGDEVLLPEAEPEEIPGDEGDPKVLEEWERLEVESEDVAVMISYTMVETLTSRHATELRAGLARMLARLKYLLLLSGFLVAFWLPLVAFWLPLVAFWLPIGCILVAAGCISVVAGCILVVNRLHFGCHWLHLGCHWLHFGCHWLHFGCHLVAIWLPLVAFCL